MRTTLIVNGREHALDVPPCRTLADALREDCGLTGTHLGCEHGVCGGLHGRGGRRRGALLPDVRRAMRRAPHPQGGGPGHLGGRAPAPVQRTSVAVTGILCRGDATENEW